MNIEAIDFLNQLNEYGKIDYADYSHLHDLLTSDGAEWEYGWAYDKQIEWASGTNVPASAVRTIYPWRVYPGMVRVRRLKAGLWEKVEA